MGEIKISILDTDERFEIKIDDKEVKCISAYSLSSDGDATHVTLEFILPREQVKFQVAY